MIWTIWKKSKLNSEKIWKICKKGNANSDKIWIICKKGKLKSEKICKIWRKGFNVLFSHNFPYHFTIFFCIFHIFSLFNLLFFHNFHIFSLFNLPFSIFCISFHFSTCLSCIENTEEYSKMIGEIVGEKYVEKWKDMEIMEEKKLNSEKILKIWK
jgi:hypothetical protein